MKILLITNDRLIADYDVKILWDKREGGIDRYLSQFLHRILLSQISPPLK